MSKLRILDFDLENRPLSYLGSDFTTSDITVIAWSFGSKAVSYAAQTLDPKSRLEMLQRFEVAYDDADIVTGHYILGHDLPIINGHLLEAGFAPLGPKMVSDTKVHLVGRKGVSASQESLGAMLELEAPKYTMTQAMWRSANRLEPNGIKLAVERCVADVKQHMEMRAKLVDLDWLKPPVYWHADSKVGGYVP